MKNLDGIHHISCITADARKNLDFYTRVMGLRLVKKTVNQDDPTVYHLFYADDQGSPGADLTFFEYPGVPQGRAGDGMLHRIGLRVASTQALDFWQNRIKEEGLEVSREDGRILFRDPEGLEFELNVTNTGDKPLIAAHSDIPAEVALQGFDGIRAYSSDPERSREFLQQGMGFTPTSSNGYQARGENRGSFYEYDLAPIEPGLSGAGTVHHVAWASTIEEHEQWRDRVIEAGAQATPVIDRFYFKSVYFREPSGALFEIATLGPGFSADEPQDHLGERLSLPPNFEPLRVELESTLVPLGA